MKTIMETNVTNFDKLKNVIERDLLVLSLPFTFRVQTHDL